MYVCLVAHCFLSAIIVIVTYQNFAEVVCEAEPVPKNCISCETRWFVFTHPTFSPSSAIGSWHNLKNYDASERFGCFRPYGPGYV